jgi:hypothetical protein
VPARLRIVVILAAQPAGDSLSFSRLQQYSATLRQLLDQAG